MPGLLTVVISVLTLTIQEFVYSLTFIVSGAHDRECGCSRDGGAGRRVLLRHAHGPMTHHLSALALIYHFFLDRFVAGFTMGAIK